MSQPNPNLKKIRDEKEDNFNAPEAAASPYGDLLAYQELYENQLDNIFTNYQKSIANLEQQEQENLQDAYFVREMSRKYLGEYASNVGVGDVSGNLLDIYGQYQQNISGIQQQFGQRELELTQQYEQQRESIKQDMFLNEFNIETARINERDKGIILNILTGETDGLSELEYLEREYAAGNISQRAYDDERLRIATEEKTIEERQTLARIYRGEADEAELEELFANGSIGLETYLSAYNVLNNERLEEGYQDFKTGVLSLDELIASGEYDAEDIQKITERSASETFEKAYSILQTFYTTKSPIGFGYDENDEMITTPEAYIESIREKFGDVSDASSTQAQLLKELEDLIKGVEGSADYKPPLEREAKFFGTEQEYTTYDENGREIKVTNPYYETYGRITDLSYFQNEGESPLGGIVYYGAPSETGGLGTYQEPIPYVISTESSIFDATGTDIAKYAVDEYGGTLVPGEVYQMPDGEFYIYQNREFFAMTPAEDVDAFKNIQVINQLIESKRLQFNTKNDGGDYKDSGDNWSWDSNNVGRDTFTFNGVEYREDNSTQFTDDGALDDGQQSIVDEFEKQYGRISPSDTNTYIIFLNGFFYIRNSKGQYQAMEKIS